MFIIIKIKKEKVFLVIFDISLVYSLKVSRIYVASERSVADNIPTLGS